MKWLDGITNSMDMGVWLKGTDHSAEQALITWLTGVDHTA